MIALLQKIIAWLISIIVSLTAMCGIDDTEKRTDDIVVLYTNDVHCAVDTSTGYAGLVSYKNEMLNETPFVTLVDCGDSIQGGTIGSVSRGEYIIDIMNYAGYDYAVVGNHEFDYGMSRIGELVDESDFTWLGCNLTYSGDGENALDGVEDYAIEDYDGTQVAFIGVSTPYSVTSSTPAYFNDGNGNRVYGFSEDNFYGTIQENIDECRAEGADYVIILGHTGNDSTYSPYSSTEIIENTNGVDAYLDAHEHNTIPCDIVENKDGEAVLLSSTGTGLVNIGKLVIDADGNVSTELISGYTEKDAGMTAYIDSIKENYNESLGKTISYNPVDLSIYTDGVRTIRSREMAIGDLVADAYREATSADIAIANGGGIRADLKKGDISYIDIQSVNPFGNKIVAVRASGQQITDALEFGARNTESVYEKDGHQVGENGGFLQVSGLSYTIDTSVENSIVTDDSGAFVSVEGERRVKNVMVLQSDGTYAPIDLDAYYTVAGTDYTLFSCGDGNSMFSGSEKIITDGKYDYETLVEFFLNHTGDYITENYSAAQGRITVK